jgi:hypothetical protein
MYMLHTNVLKVAIKVIILIKMKSIVNLFVQVDTIKKIMVLIIDVQVDVIILVIIYMKMDTYVTRYVINNYINQIKKVKTNVLMIVH